jgi:uncharacterized protein (TIGR03437 family)
VKAAPNTTQMRTGGLTIGNQIFRITQAARVCLTTLATSRVNFGVNGGTGSVDFIATCPWAANTNASWIEITPRNGTANGTVTFTVSANPGPGARTGSIDIGGQTLTVTQSAAGCTLSVSPALGTIPAAGGSGTLTVAGNSACSWQPASSSDWLTLTWSSVSGSGIVTYTAVANNTGADRRATVTVNDQMAVVTQTSVSLKFTAAGVANAASYVGGAVAPGEIVTIFGSGFGPETLAPLQLSADQLSITKILAETRALFDGVAAPLIYSVAGQLSTVVPYNVGENSTTQLRLEYKGTLSDTATLPVAASAPGIFTLDSSGKGPGAILNQDSSVNTAAAPAEKNAFVVIFATGEGLTNPAGSDGKLAVVPLAKPVLPVTVKIGGIDAEVSYAGGAPGLVAGVIQVNARIPAQAPSGDAVPVTIKIGSAESQAGVTLAIR